MTCSLEHRRQPLMNSINNNRVVSLNLSSKSNENSPKHHYSLLTPTNQEQSKIQKKKTIQIKNKKFSK